MGAATSRRRTAAACAAALALALTLAGCSDPAAEPTATPSAAAPSPTPSPTASPTEPPPTPTPSPEPTVVPLVEVASVEDVVTGLDAPWGLAFLPDGAAVVTLRDRAQVLVVRPGDGGAQVTEVTGPGAEELARSTSAGGEGGLLGVAVGPDPAPGGGVVLVLYRTTSSGNQVVRGVLDGTVLSGLEAVLDGIPAANVHNGGHVAFDAEGHLWVTTGDAGVRNAAQDRGSLGGKILRLTPDGAPAEGNPTGGSAVWSLGHRNVQGLDWADDGRLFASEFGQNALDELNLVQPGANYGWPLVEGTGGGAGLTDPLVTWPTQEASPSGLAVTAEGVYLAALRGQRLWRVPLTPDGVGEPQVVLDGLGRLRRVVEAPDGSLWVMTNNTDGRGSPRDGDDRIVRLTVRPAS